MVLENAENGWQLKSINRKCISLTQYTATNKVQPSQIYVCFALNVQVLCAFIRVRHSRRLPRLIPDLYKFFFLL